MKITSTVATSVCIFLVLLVILGMVNHLTKLESFVIDANKVGSLQYNTSADNCKDLIDELGIRHNLPDKENDILRSIQNNKYTDRTNTDGKIYGTNECVIPRGTIDKVYGSVQNCRIGNIQLQSNNPRTINNRDLYWYTEEGCVITNDQLRNNLPEITRGLYDIKYQDTEDAANLLVNTTNANYQTTGNLNNNTETNNQQTANNISLKNATDIQHQQNVLIATAAQQAALKSQGETQTYNVAATEANELKAYLADKIVGMRWYAFREYFEWADWNGSAWNVNQTLTNKFLEYMWNGRIVPFDSGITYECNNYSGLTNNANDYKITVNTTNITMMYEFIFVPDVSGYWNMEIESDDASYFWMYEATQVSDASDGKMFFSGTNPLVLSNAKIRNPGLHGMIKQSTNGQKTTPWLIEKREYKVFVVQGNQPGDPNWNPQGLILRFARPNNAFYVVRADDGGIGQYTSTFRSKYMVFDKYKRGMICKVYQGYFNDDTRFFAQRQPMTTVRLRQAYNMNSGWWSIKGHGMDVKTDSFANNEELVITGDHRRTSNNNTDLNPSVVKTHSPGTWYYPFNHLATDTLNRSVSFFGYFIPPESGDYIFYFAGDDAIYLWFGNQAKEFVRSGLSDAFDTNYGTGSAWASRPGLHWIQSQPFRVNLQKGVATPIRMVQGDWGGHNLCVFGYKRPNGEIVYDLTRDFRF